MNRFIQSFAAVQIRTHLHSTKESFAMQESLFKKDLEGQGQEPSSVQ